MPLTPDRIADGRDLLSVISFHICVVSWFVFSYTKSKNHEVTPNGTKQHELDHRSSLVTVARKNNWS